jgi:hypothetical protein
VSPFSERVGALIRFPSSYHRAGSFGLEEAVVDLSTLPVATGLDRLVAQGPAGAGAPVTGVLMCRLATQPAYGLSSSLLAPLPFLSVLCGKKLQDRMPEVQPGAIDAPGAVGLRPSVWS